MGCRLHPATVTWMGGAAFSRCMGSCPRTVRLAVDQPHGQAAGRSPGMGRRRHARTPAAREQTRPAIARLGMRSILPNRRGGSVPLAVVRGLPLMVHGVLPFGGNALPPPPRTAGAPLALRSPRPCRRRSVRRHCRVDRCRPARSPRRTSSPAARSHCPIGSICHCLIVLHLFKMGIGGREARRSGVDGCHASRWRALFRLRSYYELCWLNHTQAAALWSPPAWRGAEATHAMPVRYRFIDFQHGESAESTVLTERALCFLRNR
jgi:hypothetical protein